MTVNEYKDILQEYFYLDTDDITIRRKKDGYFNRYKKDDIVTYYKDTHNYLFVHVPKTRKSVNVTHLLCLLRNIPIPEGYDVDHLDGNKLNNHRDNIRIVTRGLNNRNRRKRSDNTSGITGIHWSKSAQRYIVRKVVKNKRISRSCQTLSEAKIVLAELVKQDNSYTQRHGK